MYAMPSISTVLLCICTSARASTINVDFSRSTRFDQTDESGSAIIDNADIPQMTCAIRKHMQQGLQFTFQSALLEWHNMDIFASISLAIVGRPEMSPHKDARWQRCRKSARKHRDNRIPETHRKDMEIGAYKNAPQKTTPSRLSQRNTTYTTKFGG